MHVVSVDVAFHSAPIDITTIPLAKLQHHLASNRCDYLVISGGDGTLRRVIKALHPNTPIPPIILHPTGSFNLMSKYLSLPLAQDIFVSIAQNRPIMYKTHTYYTLNDEVFLFSAGNMGDVQHVFIAETLRFGVLQKGFLKYMLSFVALLPLHILLTPFATFHPQKFFFFAPFRFLGKGVAQIRFRLEDVWEIDLCGSHHCIELDGDIVAISAKKFRLAPAGVLRFCSL